DLRPARTVTVPAGAGTIELQLTGLPAGDTAHRALLMTPDSGPDWRPPDLAVRWDQGRNVLAVRLDASAVPAGDYIVRVEARSPNGVRRDRAAHSFRPSRPSPSRRPTPPACPAAARP